MTATLLGPAFIAVGDGTSTFGRLAVENGRIAGVLAADGPTDYPLPAGSTIAPGLIDVHTNGAGDVPLQSRPGQRGRHRGHVVRGQRARRDSSPA